MRYEKEDLQEALRVLRAGGVILYPTDTVWGIGCDATNPEAVKRIYALKRREDTKSMLMLVHSEAILDFYAQVTETAEMLLETSTAEDSPSLKGKDGEGFETQKPLTIIYPNARNLAPNLIAEDGSIGIRITKAPNSSTRSSPLRRTSAESPRRISSGRSRPRSSTAWTMSAVSAGTMRHRTNPVQLSK